MKWAHLIFGAALFAAFAITGRYMRMDFPDKEVIPPEFRLLMRSRHIYILFSALIHLALGVYLQMGPTRLHKTVQTIGSAFLFISSGLLLQAFVAETYQYGGFSDLSRYGIYTALTGIGFHLIGGLARPIRR